MKQIIFEDFKRQWFIWGALCLLSFIVGLMGAFIEDDHIWAILLSPLWLISYLARFDLLPGTLRVILALPFTTRQIGRLYWWLRAGIPALLLAFFGGLGIFIHASFAGFQADIFEVWLGITVPGALLFGSIFWLFSGSPIPSRKARQNHFWGQFYSYGSSIAMIGGGYLLYESAISLEIKCAIIGFVGFIFSVLGWFRAEGLVMDYGAYRQVLADSSKPQRTFKPRAGYGGIPFLIISSLVRFLSVLVTGIVVLAGLSFWNAHGEGWHDFLTSIQDFRFFPFVLCLMQIFSIGTDTKFLRSLPLSSKQLSAVILCLPTIPFLILCGILIPFDLLISGIPFALSALKTEFLFMAPMYAISAIIIWRDERMFEKILLAVVVFVLSAIPAVYQIITGIANGGTRDLPIGIVVAVPLISCLLAFRAITRLLERNDMTYRIRLEAITGLNGSPW